MTVDRVRPGISRMPLVRVGLNAPSLCPTCQKRIPDKDILCFSCWQKIERSKSPV